MNQTPTTPEQVKAELRTLAMNHDPTATALIGIFENEMKRGKPLLEAYASALQHLVKAAEERNPANRK